MSDSFLYKLRQANVKRCEEAFGHRVQDWSDTDWATAIAGEVGELCNYIKKEMRDHVDKSEDIKREMADIIMYLDLFAAKHAIDLEKIVTEKFNEVSLRRNSPIKL